MKFEVYLITCNTTGKKYVGFTSLGYLKRWAWHECEYKKGGTVLYLAMKKYGPENFSIQSLITCPNKASALEQEILCIKKYNTITPNGYNMTIGGEGGSQIEQVKKKMSESAKKRYQNPEERIKMESKNRRIHSDPKVMQLQRDKAVKRWKDPEYRKKQELCRKSKEFKEQMKEIANSQWKDEEQRKKKVLGVKKNWEKRKERENESKRNNN